jgi:hypothetical protein
MGEQKPDLQFCDHGFAVSCRPETPRGEQWLRDHIAGENTYLGDQLLIEHRYLEDIVLGARADGLTCHG